MKVYCDNTLAISIAHNHISHDKTKHVEINIHFIKEKLENRQIDKYAYPMLLQQSKLQIFLPRDCPR